MLLVRWMMMLVMILVMVDGLDSGSVGRMPCSAVVLRRRLQGLESGTRQFDGTVLGRRHKLDERRRTIDVRPVVHRRVFASERSVYRFCRSLHDDHFRGNQFSHTFWSAIARRQCIQIVFHRRWCRIHTSQLGKTRPCNNHKYNSVLY